MSDRLLSVSGGNVSSHEAGERTQTGIVEGRGMTASKGNVCGLVLCGGSSRRMGEDKARIDFNGSRMLERAAAALGGATAEVLLGTGPEPRYEELGLRVVLDAPGQAGPIAGIAAALRTLEADWLCVLACDMPNAQPEVFERLLGRAREGGYDACILRSSRGREPLYGVYHRRLLPAMEAAMAAGEGRVLAFRFHPLADGRAVELAELHEAELPEGLRRRRVECNLNTPEELAAERERQGGSAG